MLQEELLLGFEEDDEIDGDAAARTLSLLGKTFPFGNYDHST